MGLLGFVGLCLLVDVSGNALAAAGGAWFASLRWPPGLAATAIFAPHVALGHLMLGVAGWRIWWRRGPGPLLGVWGWQLLAQALWAPCLFGLHSPGLGGAVAIGALLIIVETVRRFARVDGVAALLMVPTVFWIGYATYLAGGIWLLNAG